MYVTASGPDDRRRAERLKLHDHLPASFDGRRATVIEVGLLGALIEHTDRLDEGHEGRLVFEWDDEPIGLDARVARSEVSLARTEMAGEATYLSGLEFEPSPDADSSSLKRMIAFHVTRSLERMKANARGSTKPVDDAMSLLAAPAPFLGQTAEVRKIYVSCRLDVSGNWHRAEVLKPKQPLDGFTVAADYGEDEIAMLCESYEQGDEDARRMIRICAEMSLASGEDVPPPSFV